MPLDATERSFIALPPPSGYDSKNKSTHAMAKLQRTLATLLIPLASFVAPVAAQSPAQPSGTDKHCDIATSAIAAASEIRQLKRKKDVPCVVRDKESVRANL
ncbi:MAG: hypothetical protein EBZ48_17370, partial [Proteobacteria bacterium]|nr:hypothetical protein [Pseudomonadota bacterium]